MAAPTFNINPAFAGANLGANAGRQQQAGGNAQKFANRLQNVTLGNAVLRTAGVTGNDIPEGKYMGYGTAQNRGSFNTKETALMTPEVANALNNLLGQQGSEGLLPDGITQYLPDEKARIFVDRSGNGPALVLPGSQQHEAANQAGSAAGLVQIQNPYKDTGYARVGGPTWLKTIQQFAFEATQRIPTNNVSREDMEHFIAQAGVYGFGPIFNQFRVRIIPDTYTDPEGRTFARYRLGNGFDPVKIANYRPLLQGVAQRYGQIMKNPDQQALGRYGAANLALRHAEHLTDANGQAGMEAVNQAVLDAWNNGRSVAGAFHWQPGYRTFEGRRGLTAFPKRTQDGRALAANGRSLASSKNAGFCNIAGSGPGISQSARPGGDYGFRFYPQGRKYVSYKKGQQGLKLAPESWSCGFTPDYVVNPYSQRYQAGGKYALRGMSLGQALNQIGQANPDLAGYTEQDLANRYVDWTLNPGNYGTNEAFMLPATRADIDPNTGFYRQGAQHGFSKAAPARLRAAGINVASNVSATIDQKAARSDQLIREVTGQAQGQNFAGFAAASVPQARSANRGRSGNRGTALSQRAANLLGTAPGAPLQ